MLPLLQYAGDSKIHTLSDATDTLADQFELTPEEREKAFMYLTVGSQNQDFRGMLMDGEVLYCVSGWGAMNGLLDFVMLMGLSEWPKTQEELDELIPPPTGIQSGIARWFKFGL